MRRRALIAGLVVLVILAALTPILLSFRTESLGTNIRILPLDQSGSNVLITNAGTRTVQVTIGHQTFSNGKWDPPKEELFTYPFEVLRPEERFTMVFTNMAASNVSWHVVVLCQKYYPETLAGELQHFIHSRVTHRDRFSQRDHRGPQDEFLFSEIFGPASATSTGP